MRKNKLYSVTYVPKERQKPYTVEQRDKNINKVKHVKEETEYFYGDSPTCYVTPQLRAAACQVRLSDGSKGLPDSVLAV